MAVQQGRCGLRSRSCSVGPCTAEGALEMVSHRQAGGDEECLPACRGKRRNDGENKNGRAHVVTIGGSD